MSKGQGLSLNTIVIAVLALIVLVVLVIIFTGKAGWFSKESVSCQNKGGECLAKGEQCSLPAGFYTCPDAAQVCCLGR